MRYEESAIPDWEGMAPEAELDADPVTDSTAEEAASEAEATAEEALLCARATERRGRAARANFMMIRMD